MVFLWKHLEEKKQRPSKWSYSIGSNYLRRKRTLNAWKDALYENVGMQCIQLKKNYIEFLNTSNGQGVHTYIYLLEIENIQFIKCILSKFSLPSWNVIKSTKQSVNF